MAKVRFRIKQLGDPPQYACGGIHFDNGPKVRKLEPGEVLELDDANDAQADLFNQMFDKGLIELVRDMPTRPFEFADEREAQLTSPSYASTGPNDDDEIAAVKARVAERLNPVKKAEAAEKAAERDAKMGRSRRRQLANEERSLGTDDDEND